MRVVRVRKAVVLLLWTTLAATCVASCGRDVARDIEGALIAADLSTLKGKGECIAALQPIARKNPGAYLGYVEHHKLDVLSYEVLLMAASQEDVPGVVALATRLFGSGDSSKQFAALKAVADRSDVESRDLVRRALIEGTTNTKLMAVSALRIEDDSKDFSAARRAYENDVVVAVRFLILARMKDSTLPEARGFFAQHVRELPEDMQRELPQ